MTARPDRPPDRLAELDAFLVELNRAAARGHPAAVPRRPRPGGQGRRRAASIRSPRPTRAPSAPSAQLIAAALSRPRRDRRGVWRGPPRRRVRLGAGSGRRHPRLHRRPAAVDHPDRPAPSGQPVLGSIGQPYLGELFIGHAGGSRLMTPRREPAAEGPRLPEADRRHHRHHRSGGLLQRRRARRLDAGARRRAPGAAGLRRLRLRHGGGGHDGPGGRGRPEVLGHRRGDPGDRGRRRPGHRLARRAGRADTAARWPSPATAPAWTRRWSPCSARRTEPPIRLSWTGARGLSCAGLERLSSAAAGFFAGCALSLRGLRPRASLAAAFLAAVGLAAAAGFLAAGALAAAGFGGVFAAAFCAGALPAAGALAAAGLAAGLARRLRSRLGSRLGGGLCRGRLGGAAWSPPFLAGGGLLRRSRFRGGLGRRLRGRGGLAAGVFAAAGVLGGGRFLGSRGLGGGRRCGGLAWGGGRGRGGGRRGRRRGRERGRGLRAPRRASARPGR